MRLGGFLTPVWSLACSFSPIWADGSFLRHLRSLDGTPSLALGLSASRTYFIRLTPLPYPRCVGCADSKAVTRVRLQLHQLDGGAQDLVEDPGAVLDLGHLLVASLGRLLQQHLVETDLLLAHSMSPGNLGGERESPGFLRSSLAHRERSQWRFHSCSYWSSLRHVWRKVQSPSNTEKSSAHHSTIGCSFQRPKWPAESYLWKPSFLPAERPSHSN